MEGEYLSASEYAAKHGKDTGRLRRLLADGRIPGAVKIGKQWVIPAGAPWPADARVTTGEYKNWRKPKDQSGG